MFQKNDSGSYSIVGYSGDATSIEIPSEYKNKRVAGIDDGVFAGCTNLADITIPAEITDIGDDTFQECSGLTNISCAAVIAAKIANTSGSSYYNVTITGGTAILGNYGVGLKSITISDSVVEIATNAFSSCSSLTNICAQANVAARVAKECGSASYAVTITDGFFSVRDNLFQYCTGLTALTILDGVTEIGRYAFRDCSRLVSVTIPDSVTYIDSMAFSGCSIQHAVIPATAIKRIRPNTLETVVITSGTTIMGYAFSDCTNLTSLTISKSVVEIGEYAFKGCSSLTTVNYTGTKAQWQAVSIYGGNDILTGATIVYDYEL